MTCSEDPSSFDLHSSKENVNDDDDDDDVSVMVGEFGGSLRRS